MTIEEQRKLSMEKTEKLEEREYFTPKEEEYLARLVKKLAEYIKKENGIK